MVFLKKSRFAAAAAILLMGFACVSCSKKTTPVLLSPDVSTTSLSATCVQVENYYFPENRAYLAIIDQTGTPVFNFAMGNFSVSEDSRPSIVTKVGRVDNVAEPLNTVICIDRSGSMGDGPGSTLRAAQDAAIAYVTAMGNADSAEIIAFDDLIEVPQAFTTDKTALITATNALTSRGATAIRDAVVTGAVNLKGQRGRKLVIVMTDGADNSSSNNDTDCIRKVNEAGICCFSVGIGAFADMSDITTVANGTGGWAFSGDTTTLTGIFQMILYMFNNLTQVDFRTRLGDKSDTDSTRVLAVYMNYGTFSKVISRTYGH
jgi:hypothetical protein